MQAHAAAPLPPVPYGASELKQVARRYMARAVATGSATWVVVFFILLGVAPFLRQSGPELPRTSVARYLLPPPPPLMQIAAPPSPPATTIAAPKAGIAVPVPDEQAPPDATIPTQRDLGAPGPVEQPGEGKIIVPPSQEEPLPERGTWTYREQEPVAIRTVSPEYPEMARTIGIEGKVMVLALVGKDGRVKDAYVDPKQSVPGLDESAVEAVKRWVFTPALVNNHPVAVWIAVPMRFKLH